MKIVVCFKILPNPDRILKADFEQFSLDLDLAYAGSELNCFDASALESAIKLKEQAAVQGADVTCTALTVSKALSKSFCENLFAIGFDEVIAIPSDQRECMPQEISALLKEEIQKQKADFVFMGKEAGFMESGSVPYFVANTLDFPLVPDIETLSYMENGISINYRNKVGLFKKEISAPAVCIFANSPYVLRYATLKKRMLVRGKKAKELELVKVENPKEQSFSRVCTARSCKMQTEEEILKEIKNSFSKEREKVQKKKEQKTLSNTVLIDIEAEEFLPLESLQEIPFENEKSYCFLDTPIGRKAAVDFAALHHLPCRFHVEINSDGDKWALSKRICASNLLLKENYGKAFVCTIPKEEKENYIFSSALSLKGRKENEAILLEKAKKTNLATADFLVVCGNGMGSKDAVQKARVLSKKLGAVFGLTRPAALNAWGSPLEIVGQSGTITSPTCVLALGVAGAGAFFVGIEKAKKIIAVNTDQNALLFQNADIGVTMDAETLVDRLLKLL